MQSLRKEKLFKLEDIENLRKKQLKKVIIGFADKCNEKTSSIRGIESVISTGSGTGSSFMYSGEIHELITFLSGKTITDLTIEEPSLEEIFMHYYK